MIIFELPNVPEMLVLIVFARAIHVFLVELGCILFRHTCNIDLLILQREGALLFRNRLFSLASALRNHLTHSFAQLRVIFSKLLQVFFFFNCPVEILNTWKT